MKLSSVNYPLASVAAVTVFVFNSLWYSPWLFGPVWVSGIGLDPGVAPGLFTFVASLVLGLVAAIVVFALAAALAPAISGGGGIKAGLALNLILGGGILLLNMLSGLVYLPYSGAAILVAVAQVYLATQIYCSLACYAVQRGGASGHSSPAPVPPVKLSFYLSKIRYLHCLLATVIVFFLGMLIYGLLFGEVWMRGVGYSAEDLTEGPVPVSEVLFNVVSSFLIASVIYLLAALLAFRGWRRAFELSLWIGLGLVGASALNGGLFSPHPWEVAAIDLSYLYLKTLVFCIFACVWPKSAA